MTMILSKKDAEVQDKALSFARANKKTIAKKYTDKTVFIPENRPVSVFMAGSPGAGKTEASVELVEVFERTDYRVIRIDPDVLRHEFEDYSGETAICSKRPLLCWWKKSMI